MSNLHEIISGVFLGDCIAAYNKNKLSTLGITHVLNTATELDTPFEGIKYMHLKLRDSPSENIYIHFENCHRFIDQALETKGKILIHCYAGISRSATVVASYLIKKFKMTVEQTLSFMKNIRNVVRPNLGFIEQLKTFYRYGYFDLIEISKSPKEFENIIDYGWDEDIIDWVDWLIGDI